MVGPSGSGKSSLVRAGLLPALADGVLPGSDRWRQLMRPGEHPLRELAEVGDHPGAPADAGQSRASADGGTGDSHSVPGAGGDLPLLRAIASQERVLLVVDQFEEAFTLCHDQGERARFLATLAEAAQADNSVTVVVAVRADYYGHGDCAANPALASLLAANHVLVGPMDAGELRRAIELPARRAGLQLEPGPGRGHDRRGRRRARGAAAAVVCAAGELAAPPRPHADPDCFPAGRWGAGGGGPPGRRGLAGAGAR